MKKRKRKTILDSRLHNYDMKYGDIPLNFKERFDYLLDAYKFSKKDMDKLSDAIHDIDNIQKDNLYFTILLEPQPTARPRVTFNRVYVPHSEDNAKMFREFMSWSDLPKIKTPTKLECVAYFPTPKSLNKLNTALAEIGYIKHITRPDWDNIGKTYSDMIQHGLLLEDSLIYHSDIKKMYSIKPRIEINLYFDSTYDCAFSEKLVKSWKCYVDETNRS